MEQAINHALSHNRQLAASAFSVEAGRLGLVQAQLEFQPLVQPRIDAALSGDDRDVTYGLHAAKKFSTGTTVNAALLRQRDGTTGENPYATRVAIEIGQPILRDAGRLIHAAPLAEATAGLLKVRRDLEVQKTDLVVRVVAKYEEVFKLSHQVRAAAAALQRLDSLYRLTKAKETIGRAKRVDTLRAEFQRGQALSRLEADREQLFAARQDLAELLGMPPTTEFELETAPILEYSELVPETAIYTALENRLDYAQALHDYRESTRRVFIARRQLLPGLRAVARYTWSEGNDPAGAALTGSTDGRIFFGISADTDLNKTRDRTLLHQSQLDQTEALHNIKTLELVIAREVRQNIGAYRRARAEISIAEENLERADVRLRLARRLFELGRGDNFGVSEAEDAYSLAKTQLLSARAQVITKAYELARATGTVTSHPAELRPEPL